MQICNHLLLLAFCAFPILASDPKLVTHEKRHPLIATAIDIRRHKIEPNALLPMRIALKQNQYAVSNAESWLMDVSDPASRSYAQHWNQNEVMEAFEPSSKTVSAVKTWLLGHGVSEFTHSDNKQWIAFDITVEKAEILLKTSYFERESSDDKGNTLGFEAFCDEYHVPEHLADHIDLIKPGLQGSDVTGRTARSRQYLRDSALRALEKRFHCEPGGVVVVGGKPVSVNGAEKPEPAHPTCGDLVTPKCIRELYDIPLADPNIPVSTNNSLGLFQAYGTLYYQGSIDLFNKRYTDIPAGYEPIFQPIDGAIYPPNSSFGRDWKYVAGEGDTDLESAMPIIYPQNATVFEIRGSHSFTRFLDAIDGSYCTPSQNFTANHKPQCGVYKPTNVISISYSFDERSLSPLWLQRQCLEYLKLGLQGVTLFTSSGDLGVEFIGPPQPEQGKSGCWKVADKLRFGPAFPQSCPWITAVGATEIARNSSVHEPEVAATSWVRSDGHPQFSFASGGGFSDHFDRPRYQDTSLLHYLNNATDFKMLKANISGKYNHHGRGYPDLSANGKKVALCGWNLCQQLNCSQSAGTSISSPIVAGIFNRINEERIRVGKNPVGFVNPTLYKNAHSFNDITRGGNGYCTEGDGFKAVPGWDPVTGVGTPNYPKLLDIFMKLP